MPRVPTHFYNSRSNSANLAGFIRYAETIVSLRTPPTQAQVVLVCYKTLQEGTQHLLCANQPISVGCVMNEHPAKAPLHHVHGGSFERSQRMVPQQNKKNT